MPKVKSTRIKIDSGDRLLDYENEQKANIQVYNETGICIHPLKDLRYSEKGCKLICACCGSKLQGEKSEVLEMNPHWEKMLREMFVEVARLFGIEIVEILTEKCLTEWKKISLTLGWCNTKNTGSITSRRNYAAYIFYKVCIDEEIYKSASEVARLFDTTLAKLLLAEDTYCMESGREKIYLPLSKQFEAISQWLFITWAEKRFICSLIDHIERKLFGKSGENIIMIAICLSKKFFPRGSKDDVDIERAEELLHVKSLKEEGAQLKSYEKLFEKELNSLLEKEKIKQ